MENREILVANTKTQTRNKVVTNATTLGELKAALDREGIDYEGMTFTEGISKTQLLNDDTQLPQNLMYKGQLTNSLVILLTNTKKKIASGSLSRADAYAAIRSRNLQEAVKKHFGRNFTLVSTPDLLSFIGEDTSNGSSDSACGSSKDAAQNSSSLKAATVVPSHSASVAEAVSDAFCIVIDRLYKDAVLSLSDLSPISRKVAAFTDSIVGESLVSSQSSAPVCHDSTDHAEKGSGTIDGIDDYDLDGMIDDLGM